MRATGNYGVEWVEPPAEKDSGVLAITVTVVVFVALISLAWTLIVHYRERKAEEAELLPKMIERAETVEAAAERTAEKESPPPPPVKIASDQEGRPQLVRNLLMRLEEAQKRRDTEMEVSTIEQLRALPGSPAADLDDKLARRLGSLNLRRLFVSRNGQWVKQIEVRSGQSASRIASENGSTFASFARLNGGKVDKVFAGRKMYVLDHPRFILIVHRRLSTADLQLNGKFFKRYDLRSAPELKEGSYEWGAAAAKLDVKGKDELELLMPKKANVVVSEM